MKKLIVYGSLLIAVSTFIFFSCKKQLTEKDTKKEPYAHHVSPCTANATAYAEVYEAFDQMAIAICQLDMAQNTSAFRFEVDDIAIADDNGDAYNANIQSTCTGIQTYYETYPNRLSSTYYDELWEWNHGGYSPFNNLNFFDEYDCYLEEFTSNVNNISSKNKTI